MYARSAWDSSSKQILLFTTFSFLPLFPHRFSKSPTVFDSGRQSEGFSKVGAGVGGIVCVSGLSGSWALGRMALVYPHPSIQEVLALWTFVAVQLFAPLYHCPSLFPHFCICVSFPQGGSPPSQVIPEQILQRRAIPTNTPTMSLWSVTSLLILRGQSSIMQRMIPRLRAVGTQVGTYAVNPACMIQFLHVGFLKKKKLVRVRNVYHAKGERHRTWIIEWDQKKQHNSE